MRIGAPTEACLPRLRALWKEAFGDDDAFLDCFYETAFAYARCRCVTEGDTLAAALYWFECTLGGERIAYLYGVATANAFRGKGLCRALMEDTHRHLQALGYRGAVLVPAKLPLVSMYEKMGYRVCSHRCRTTCRAEAAPLLLEELSPMEYAVARRGRLPMDGVLQEGENLEFLSRQARFYRGDDFLLAARREDDRLVGIELLGSVAPIAAITHALGCKDGEFLTAGSSCDEPFAMYCGFDGLPAPRYFGFAFD